MSKIYKSYCLTVRPRLGLNPDSKFYEVLLAWLKKLPHCVAVTEKGGEAMHLHAQIWSEQGWVIGNLRRDLRKKCEKHIEDWDKDQAKLKGGCNYIRIAYNEWFQNYLLENELKPEEVNLLIDNPPDIQEPFYPSEEEQDTVKAKANAKDQLMHSWLELWEEHGENYTHDEDTNIWYIPGCSLLCVAKFCRDIWFKLKLKPTLRNVRDQRDFVKRVHSYIRGYCPDEDLIGPGDLEVINTFIDDVKNPIVNLDNG